LLAQPDPLPSRRPSPAGCRRVSPGVPPPGPVCLPPRVPAGDRLTPPLRARGRREAGAAPRPGRRLPDRGGPGRGAEDRHRYSRGLPAVRRTMAGGPGRELPLKTAREAVSNREADQGTSRGKRRVMLNRLEPSRGVGSATELGPKERLPEIARRVVETY